MYYDLHGEKPAIEPGSLILVTGVTGLIGGHVANSFLEAGYKVRGTTRSRSKGQWTIDYFEKTFGPGRYELIEVADMETPEAYTEALKGVSGIAHVASDLSMNPNPNEVIPPVLAKLNAILTAAASTPTVTRFVLTSSSTALVSAKPNQKITITTSTWNEEAVKAAWAPPPYDRSRSSVVYAASKTQGEQEAWKFVREQKPHFVLNTILPNSNFGRKLTREQNGSSINLIAGPYLSGSFENVSFIRAQWAVDVEDTALLHVAAMIDPEIQGERILSYAQPFNWSIVAGIFKHLAPKGRKLPDPIDGEGTDLMIIPNERGAEILKRFDVKKGKGWTGLEESLRKTITQLEEFEKSK